jgi:hypothetical protein
MAATTVGQDCDARLSRVPWTQERKKCEIITDHILYVFGWGGSIGKHEYILLFNHCLLKAKMEHVGDR